MGKVDENTELPEDVHYVIVFATQGGIVVAGTMPRHEQALILTHAAYKQASGEVPAGGTYNVEGQFVDEDGEPLS